MWCWAYRGCEILQDEQQDRKVYRTPEVITKRGWYRTGVSLLYVLDTSTCVNDELDKQ